MATDFKAINARTGERRRAATQQDLLDATVRLLEDDASFASLSIDKIVKEAGVVRTTFYLHFKDKHDLIDRLAEEQVAWIETIGTGAVRDPELTLVTIRQTTDEIVAAWAANRAVLAAIIEFAEYDARMREKWAAAMRHVAQAAAGVFDQHWDVTGLAPDHPDRVAEALTWMIERSCHQLVADPGARDELSAALAEIIWRVLRSSSSRPGRSRYQAST